MDLKGTVYDDYMCVFFVREIVKLGLEVSSFDNMKDWKEIWEKQVKPTVRNILHKMMRFPVEFSTSVTLLVAAVP
jgi:hypothetical protein